MAYRASGGGVDNFGLCHADAFDEEFLLDEIKKHYVMTARAKGLSEGQVLYGHVFRNAMLIVIAGFPAVVYRGVLWRLAYHRDDFLA